MGTANIRKREEELIEGIWSKMTSLDNLHVLADNVKDRLGVISFYIDDLHYNLGVKLLNDRFGIQVRGGCSCAGTYGHYLLQVSQEKSNYIKCSIDDGDYSNKPGWIRLSLHPTLKNSELEFIGNAIIDLATNFVEWQKDYSYNTKTNEYEHKYYPDKMDAVVSEWFEKVVK